MATVAVREWMDLHQPVMKSDRYFVGRISLVGNPQPGVVTEGHQSWADLIPRPADVFIGLPEFSGPPPDFIEM